MYKKVYLLYTKYLVMNETELVFQYHNCNNIVLVIIILQVSITFLLATRNTVYFLMFVYYKDVYKRQGYGCNIPMHSVNMWYTKGWLHSRVIFELNNKEGSIKVTVHIENYKQIPLLCIQGPFRKYDKLVKKSLN